MLNILIGFLTLTTLPPSKTRRYGSIRKLEDKLYALATEYRGLSVKILKPAEDWFGRVKGLRILSFKGYLCPY